MSDPKKLSAPLNSQNDVDSGPQSLPSFFKSFDYIIDLKLGEAHNITDRIKLCYNGEVNFYGYQAKFAIKAPPEICIMRLEAFANYNQDYDQVLQLNLGDKVVVADKNFVFTVLQVVKGLVKFGLYSNEKIEIKKSFVNSKSGLCKQRESMSLVKLEQSQQ